jgi:hypothetical protein
MVMRQLRLKLLFSMIIGMTLLQFAYVNCTKAVIFDQSAKTSMEGNGDGYSGKLYVVVNSGGLCPDGSPYLAQIDIPAEEAYLVRESCASITPKQVQVVVSSVDSNFLAYDQQVFKEDSAIAVIPQAPTVLAAMGMVSDTATNKACNGADCWKFDVNGAISREVDFASAAEFEFTILARADLALGVGANLDLSVDGVTVGSTIVASSSDAEYLIKANVPAGRHEIAIAFTNDYQDLGSGADRNLYVTSVGVKAAGVVTSACLNRTSGSLLTLTNAQVPIFNKSLASSTRIDATAVSYAGNTNSPMRLGSGSNMCMAGGSVAGTWPMSADFSTMNPTFGMAFDGSNFLLENYRADNFGNCIGVINNASGFTIRSAYCTQTRGDFVSNKNSWGGTIEDSLFDGGISFFNDTGSLGASAGATTTIRNNLVRLQSFPVTYWGTPGHGWFWRHDSSMPVKLRLHGNVFMAEQASLNGDTLNPSTILSCKKADGSPDNIIVWLGTGAYPRPTELDTGCFTLTTDRTVWDQAVADWKASHGY